jgi:hypothetical protein
MARPSWKGVAERLAGRLANHAFCETHGPGRPDPDCPFCDDRTAYAEYIAAGGYDHRPIFEGGQILSFKEWKALAETTPDAPTGGED